ncbi:hypothetical protein [Sedimenticola hydrogenitrophicus]|uniref:hypothetical protein n=1 Tax=Sedimenticola hydrogenitrophicus TaxID=2967975 RepID=UPI0023B11DF6|nr:hypothetical protein [Sedimenticola hydrogenitrophicus]
MRILKRFLWIWPILLVLVPATGLADRIEGRLNGLACASRGEVCPTDKDDPHVLLERDFVIQTEDGKIFYITNMDWNTKLRYVLRKVRVVGKFSERSSAIAADEFWVKHADGYRLEWSLERAREKQRRAQQLRRQQEQGLDQWQRR